MRSLHVRTSRRATSRHHALLRWGAAVLVVAGLAVDAYTHYDLAGRFDPNTTGTISEGLLFRVEATAAVVVAVLVLVFRNAAAALLAAFVAGGGALLLFVYRYVDVGGLGPIPNMYEPVWYAEKTVAAVGELVALLFATIMLASRPGPARHDRPVSENDIASCR